MKRLWIGLGDIALFYGFCSKHIGLGRLTVALLKYITT